MAETQLEITQDNPVQSDEFLRPHEADSESNASQDAQGLAGANGVSAGSSLARLRHRWWKVRSFLRGKFSAVDGTV